MILRCAVSCLNPEGHPDFYFAKVLVSQPQYDAGLHVDAVMRQAQSEGYECPGVVYDERTGHDWLLNKLDWSLFPTIAL